MTPGVPEVWIRRDIDPADLRRVIRHEAAHHFGLGEKPADKFGAGHYGPVWKRTRFRVTF
jgi:hypothetical protein